MRHAVVFGALVAVGLLSAPRAEACGGFFCAQAPIDQAGERIVFGVSGNSVEARRLGIGTYEVRFNGAGPVLALVDILESSLPTITSVSSALVSAGTFRVQTVDTATGGNADNVSFVIATL